MASQIASGQRKIARHWQPRKTNAPIMAKAPRMNRAIARNPGPVAGSPWRKARRREGPEYEAVISGRMYWTHRLPGACTRPR